MPPDPYYHKPMPVEALVIIASFACYLGAVIAFILWSIMHAPA